MAEERWCATRSATRGQSRRRHQGPARPIAARLPRTPSLSTADEASGSACSYTLGFMQDLAGKTVLITGATSGIGLEASVALARMGAQVVMVGRDRRKTAEKVGEVRSRSGRARVDYLLCD